MLPRTFQLALLFALLLTVSGGAGCSAPRHNSLGATQPYYAYQFTAAREALRGPTETTNDQNVVLNNVRLGLAALADGDPQEAERTFSRVFELLSTAGLNKDRTTAAVLLNEGVKVFKGEPFEQALTYYWIASLYATMGDWENARAAIANSLFRLTDFIGDKKDGKPPADGKDYNVVDTNFALGFLMLAAMNELSNSPGLNEQLDAALAIDPSLGPIVDVLRSGEYDTLLIVDYGKGPVKQAYGQDEALVRFVPMSRAPATLSVSSAGSELARFNPVCDVNAMAEDLRWNDLENVRKAKSFTGNVLVVGGLTAAAIGANQRSGEAVLAGLGAAAVGMLTKSGARADTRYIDFAPQLIFFVPVRVGENKTISIRITGGDTTEFVLPDFEPGEPGNPRAVYLRLHGPHAIKPDWMTATELQYSNDNVGVSYDDYPWILGGRDVSTPTRKALDRYHASGKLNDITINELIELYAMEDILIGSGMETRDGYLRNPSYRHILDGGTGLFTPMEYSVGYKRLMYTQRSPYRPKSERVRELSQRINGTSPAPTTENAP